MKKPFSSCASDLMEEMAESDYPFHAKKRNRRGKKIVDRIMHPGFNEVFSQDGESKQFSLKTESKEIICQMRKKIGKFKTPYLGCPSFEKIKPYKPRRKHQKAQNLTSRDKAK